MFKINYDALGIATSVACAIHCAVLPLVLTSLPIFGVNIINNYLFEYGMILLAFLVGAFTLLHGFKKHHHKKLPLTVFSIGIFFLVLKETFHEFHIWLLVPAVVMIITAHFLNYNYCRKAKFCHSTDCTHEELVG
ncbi:MAG: MerC domain-containing protein [Bacteroidetes bacterium]|nr:MAG: MerC domain-containing protein [Bacteroidota bacterium]